MEAEHRPLRRRERALIYAALGVALEVTFTAVQANLRGERDPHLRGHTYLWMLPVYASAAGLFEPLHGRLCRRPTWQRAMVYAAGITTVELAAGTTLRRMTGSVPWDYTGHSRAAMAQGAIRLDYLPLWAGLGLLLERVDELLHTARIPAHR